MKSVSSLLCQSKYNKRFVFLFFVYFLIFLSLFQKKINHLGVHFINRNNETVNNNNDNNNNKNEQKKENKELVYSDNFNSFIGYKINKIEFYIKV